MNTAAAERQEIGEGLGASEISAAAGLDPFRSPLQLWLEKTGQAPPFAGNEITDWGLEVELPMVAWYGRRHTSESEVLIRPKNSMHRKEPAWARCTPDGVVHDLVNVGPFQIPSEGPIVRVVQAKNVGFRMMHRWQDGPPDYVVCQCAWECFVVGIGRADVIASLGGGPPEVYTLWRDEQMVADLLAIGERFMRHVAERTEPRTTHHADWATYLANRAKSRGFIVPATAADESLVEEWRTSTLALKAAEKRSDLAKNRVRRYLADANADGMETAFGVATWRPNKNGDRALRPPRGWGSEGDK